MAQSKPRRWGRRRFLLMAAFTVAGVVMLVGARFVDSQDVWFQGLLLNVGAAFLLSAPLWWFGRELARTEERIEEQVDAVRSDLVTTQQQIATLVETAARVTQAEQERDQHRTDAVNAIGEAPDQVGVREALNFATTERAISGRGIRVRSHPGFDHYLRFGPGRFVEDIDVVLERRNGEPVGEPIVWRPEQSAAQFMLNVSEALTAASVHPGASFEGGRLIFTALADALETARRVKARFAGVGDASDVVEVCGDQWSVCDWGVLGWIAESSQPYEILAEDIGVDRWREHMSEKDWVDMDQLLYALRTCQAIYARDQEVADSGGTPNGI